MTSTRPFSLRGQTLYLLCLIVTCGSTAVSQQAARPERGTMPNRTYSLSDIENISLQNGNVNLSIPLASLPPIAGGKLSWPSAQTTTVNYGIRSESRRNTPKTWNGIPTS